MDVSLSSVLAGQATALQDIQNQSQFGVAVLKQTLDQEKRAGAALVAMIDQTPRPAPAPGHVDLCA